MCRSNAIGVSSMASRVGSILAPYMIGLHEKVPWLPNVVFGLFTIISAILSFLLLPETNNQPLPESIQDGEELIKKNTKSFIMSV